MNTIHTYYFNDINSFLGSTNLSPTELYLKVLSPPFRQKKFQNRLTLKFLRRNNRNWTIQNIKQFSCELKLEIIGTQWIVAHDRDLQGYWKPNKYFLNGKSWLAFQEVDSNWYTKNALSDKKSQCGTSARSKYCQKSND